MEKYRTGSPHSRTERPDGVRNKRIPSLNRRRKTIYPAPTAHEALKKALKFLGYRPHSETEIRRKLARLGCSQKITDTTLRKLRSLRIVDDEAFARNWARERFQIRGYGPIRVAGELKQKGIERPLIDSVLRESFGQEKEMERAKQILGRRFHNLDVKDYRSRIHAASYLERRGYRSAVIAEVLKHSLGEEWQNP